MSVELHPQKRTRDLPDGSYLTLGFMHIRKSGKSWVWADGAAVRPNHAATVYGPITFILPTGERKQ